MRYIKRGYIRNVEYMRVEKEDQNFYKGLSLCFDKNEEQIHEIHVVRWMDFKSVKYLLTEITKEEFENKLKIAISYLSDIR